MSKYRLDVVNEVVVEKTVTTNVKLDDITVLAILGGPASSSSVTRKISDFYSHIFLKAPQYHNLHESLLCKSALSNEKLGIVARYCIRHRLWDLAFSLYVEDLNRGSPNEIVWRECQKLKRTPEDISHFKKRSHLTRFMRLICAVVAAIVLQFCSAEYDNAVLGEPTVECADDYFEVKLETRSPFRGVAFVQSHLKDPSCRSQLATENPDRNASLRLTFDDCAVERRLSV
ncbi:unnamed protein product [Caenorhabditis auriculariae]|uniref:ZP domain-containing protein n=1 Tax=Caenorhabditis auriculariae TaxID=2777116 RepID=A0A8S1H243_9PELO|nr:unnamed protein product [Caenorhabditis auriculariae]